MKYKMIETKEEYNNAIAEMDSILDSGKDDEATMNHINVMSLLIEQYEDKTMSIELPAPIEAIKTRMEDLGLQNSDMVEYFGQISRVSEVLNYKRKLSLSMMRKLSKGLHISMEILTQEYTLHSKSTSEISRSSKKQNHTSGRKHVKSKISDSGNSRNHSSSTRKKVL